MRILKAGTWIEPFAPPVSPRTGNIKGLTLLELIVVMAVLSALLLVIFPKIPYLETFTLNSDARRAAGLFRYLDETATQKKVYYRVWFSPEKGSIDVESSPDGAEFKKAEDAGGFILKNGVEISDIVLQGLGRINQGEAAVIFNPGAGAEPFSLHLRKSNRTVTISYNPYSGKVKVADGYV